MEKPYLIVTSEKVSKEYLDYLDQQNISWIVCGKEKIDLNKVCEILYEEFHVERMGIVGGPAINTSFLDEGLLDEISLLIGAGIDGRKEFPSVFDGLENTHPLIHLKLLDVKRFKSDAIWPVSYTHLDVYKRQAQRVMIALVLCLQPSLVLADEPTSSLDVVIQKQILDYLLNLKKQTTFVFVTHNIQVARYIADQIVVMKDGIIVEKGNVETLFNAPQHPYTKSLL